VDTGEEIPEETNGPFPADGSNGVNVLTESGVVRSDIRPSFGDADGVAEGVPLAVTLTVVDVSSASNPGSAVAGAAIYVWHCDRGGNYSLYSPGFEDENWLRGVQKTDAKGQVTFTTVFPGCYSGRWPHIHFEVYPSISDATRAQNRQRTSQLAFPADACNDVYATPDYASSVRNFQGMSLDTDNVFSDGHSLQLATVSGSVRQGYRATLRVPI
jgi:protocatechuate 3,4-dioxygenase beta subunit